MVSWSLLIVHMTPAMQLQLMQGLYNCQQRPLTSKKDTKSPYRFCLDFSCRKPLTI